MTQPAPDFRETLREGRTFTVRRMLGENSERVIVKQPTRPSDTANARLENEYNITRGLCHPSIVRAQDLRLDESGPTLILPDDGLSSLDLRPAGNFTVAEVRMIARDIAGALAHIHESGLIHRDVKPSNIIASSDFAEIKLIDFCLAIHEDDLKREAPGTFAAHGTPAFMAPEQSGRMNRAVDARADLYSLGVTLYELLTGIRPFDDKDPAQITYRHMTDVPPAPAQMRDMPEDLSAAVMVLLEKNPEDRFQSANEFLAAIDGGGRRRPRLSMPDRLYGRDDLIETLAQEISIGATGPNRFYRFAGPSGIGKSALIQCLVQPAIARGATYLPGKFDQADLNRPYGPFLQAAQHLLRRLLAGSPEEVELWRARILESVSPNGQVLLEVLPDYRTLIGPQPDVAELGLNEARIRMSLVFRRFVRALAHVDSPLILFFDDLQWSDSASRTLIELLLCDPEIRNLTIICAYRENEVGATHPARELFARLEERIDLQPELILGPVEIEDSQIR